VESAVRDSRTPWNPRRKCPFAVESSVWGFSHLRGGVDRVPGRVYHMGMENIFTNTDMSAIEDFDMDDLFGAQPLEDIDLDEVFEPDSPVEFDW
jgi:hypothetical protein